MQKLKKLFNEIQEKNPNLSSLVCLSICMTDGKWGMRIVTDGLNKLVDKSDYEIEDYDEILTYLIEMDRKYS